MNLEALYQEILLDHYRRPRNKGRLPGADVHEHGVNPFCGDQIELYLKLDGDKVTGVRFDGTGCSISQASASMMTEAIRGKTLDEVRTFVQRVEEMLKGGDGGSADLGELEALRGVGKFPVRIKCALLAWKVLERALDEGTPSETEDSAQGALTNTTQ